MHQFIVWNTQICRIFVKSATYLCVFYKPKLLIRTVESRFEALNYYENGSTHLHQTFASFETLLPKLSPKTYTHAPTYSLYRTKRAYVYAYIRTYISYTHEVLLAQVFFCESKKGAKHIILDRCFLCRHTHVYTHTHTHTRTKHATGTSLFPWIQKRSQAHPWQTILVQTIHTFPRTAHTVWSVHTYIHTYVNTYADSTLHTHGRSTGTRLFLWIQKKSQANPWQMFFFSHAEIHACSRTHTNKTC